MTSADFWADGDHRGRAAAGAGRLHDRDERVAGGVPPVAWQRFEDGRGLLAGPAGLPARFTSDPATGRPERVAR
jgi:hypothetical protein